jgi:hypothetical protein
MKHSDRGPKHSVSEARLAANRANAKKSTGPRTAAGKRVAATNATKHGVFADSAFAVPRGPFQESAEEIAAYVDGVISALGPRDDLERSQARTIAILFLNAERLTRLASHAIADDARAPSSDNYTRASELCNILEGAQAPEQMGWKDLCGYLSTHAGVSTSGVPKPNLFKHLDQEYKDVFWALIAKCWTNHDEALAWARQVRAHEAGAYDAAVAAGADKGAGRVLGESLERTTRIHGRLVGQIERAYALYERLKQRQLEEPGQNKPILDEGDKEALG